MTELRYKFDDGGNLTSVICPRYAFKFASVTDYTISALSEKYFWFSKPSEFNDVFELPTKTPKQFSPDQLKRYMLTNLPYHLPKKGITLPADGDLESILDGFLENHTGFAEELFSKMQEARKELVRIFCMSMRYDDPLMWAHYASSFSGICLVFDFPQLIHNQPWFAIQVQYVEETPIYDPVESSLQHHAASEPYSNHSLQFQDDQIQFGIKLKTWEHEQEVRLCSLDPNPIQHYPPHSLVGIILGPRISADNRKTVEAAAIQGRGNLTIESLVVDDENTSLRAPGLVNESVEINVQGVRNLAKEMQNTNDQSK